MGGEGQGGVSAQGMNRMESDGIRSRVGSGRLKEIACRPGERGGALVGKPRWAETPNPMFSLPFVVVHLDNVRSETPNLLHEFVVFLLGNFEFF